MPTYHASLSTSSLDALLRDLEAYQKQVEAAPAKVVAELVKTGTEDMEANLAAITDRDGNIDVDVEGEQNGSKGRVSLTGPQAAYIEFGTGVTGGSAPHPLAAEAGWDYASGPRIFTTKAGRVGWRYYNREKNRWLFTEGLAPQMPAYNAARKIRAKVVETTKEALK